MKFLFDTHALFWFLDGDSKLSPRAREAIGAQDAVIVASAVSAWEFANKVRIGKWPRCGGLQSDSPSTLKSSRSSCCPSPPSTLAWPVSCQANTAIPSTGCSPRSLNSKTCR